MKESFEIKSMCLDGYEIPIPEGFSDLMNRSGAWRLIESDKKENPLVEEYDRKVVKEGGRLRSYLTYKGPK